MRYLPHTLDEVAEMLSVVGLKHLEDLFKPIPASLRSKKGLAIPGPLTEWELEERIAEIADIMASTEKMKIFLGAGSYRHYIPESVRYLLSRSEFSTSYTPYQPEISQGTLQAIFEYQTLVSRLLGMDMANASIYDGATSLSEAVLMAIRITRKRKVAVSRLIHPNYRRVLETYLTPAGYDIVELPYLETGRTDISSLNDFEDIAAVAVQSPNFMGMIEDLKMVREKTKDRNTLLICAFSEPLAYGLLKPPGAFGADIACGEGQSFGISQSFGGPALGMFAFKKDYVRNAPGRLVGQTTDLDGNRGYVLTLATREQHIRREKATSNICTNQGLCALASAMYMASIGGTGIKELARLNYDKAAYLKEGLRKKGLKLKFDGPTFNEFVVEYPKGAYQNLMKKGMVIGLPLEPFYPELAGQYLVCVTETIKKEDMDNLIKEM
ncbi:MAG: aminomethyl-transferring glycine dehydrogenase subunit GcvPA [Proteobacteria bacterium]|nr:aminomethyl-transferring glycine dehydrogenase subunit GcvPA [Pseudomonadota bacterium]